MHRPPRARLVPGLLAALLLVAACTDDADTRAGTPDPSPRPDTTTTATRPPCDPPASVGDEVPREAKAHSDGDTELWALYFHWPVRAGEEVKVVWRMTGEGEFTIGAKGPDGRTVEPVWGPEPHGGSTWERPGDEWGTGWIFPVPGCWRIHAERDTGAGYLDLEVGPAAKIP